MVVSDMELGVLPGNLGAIERDWARGVAADKVIARFES
jgi:hypothetical protein